MFKAEIICDSIGKNSQERLTTFVLTLPKFLLQELNTHRTKASNAGSSRAIPPNKLVDKGYFIPTFWGKNKPGMQASEEIERKEEAIQIWEEAHATSVDLLNKLFTLGLHKQIVNRLMEPFAYVDVVFTSSYWYNFFKLRAHEATEPHMCYEATLMLIEYLKSTPKVMEIGDWHIPMDPGGEELDLRLKRSVARCARASTLNFYGKDEVEADLKLYNMLQAEGHWSPFEHQAKWTTPFIEVTPTQEDLDTLEPEDFPLYSFHGMSGCLSSGWQQYRKLIEIENTEENTDLEEICGKAIKLCESRGFKFV